MTAALSNIGSLSSLLSLPTITSKPPAAASQATVAALDEAKKKVEKQANSISIKEFTDVSDSHCYLRQDVNAHATLCISDCAV